MGRIPLLYLPAIVSASIFVALTFADVRTGSPYHHTSESARTASFDVAFLYFLMVLVYRMDREIKRREKIEQRGFEVLQPTRENDSKN
jgi:hypothetical protein